MKKFSLFVTILATSTLCFSQDKKVKFGIHGGINISNITSKFTYSNLGTSYTTDLPSSSITGFTGGIHAEILLGKNFYLQPELSYSQLGAKNVSSNQDTTISSRQLELKSTLHYIVLPILVKYKIAKTGLGIFAGPQFGYLLGITNKINSTRINEKDESNFKRDFSGIFGAEYYLPLGLGISAQYQLGISNIQKPSYFDVSTLPPSVKPESISVRNKAFIITVGYRF